ncbi:hypothetical protein FRB90_001405, partial [Tulasnella sp. 427]
LECPPTLHDDVFTRKGPSLLQIPLPPTTPSTKTSQYQAHVTDLKINTDNVKQVVDKLCQIFNPIQDTPPNNTGGTIDKNTKATVKTATLCDAVALTDTLKKKLNPHASIHGMLANLASQVSTLHEEIGKKLDSTAQS